MRLHDVVSASREVAATRSRLTKRALIAATLDRADPDDVEIVVTYLSGELRQRRTGIGWASLAHLPEPASEPSLELGDVDAAFEKIAALSGPGSQQERRRAVEALFGRATAEEQRFLAGLLSGNVRQGALDAVMVESVAEASGVPVADVRRAVMLHGETPEVARVALTEGAEGISRFRLTVGRPIRPMLAASAPDVQAALEKLGTDTVSLDAKIDGIRIQVHKQADEVRIFTRSLDEITTRLPEVAVVARALPVRQAILDGEAIALDAGGRPRPFQETAARTASRVAGEQGVSVDVTPFFFDCLHVDGDDLIDQPLSDRLARLDTVVPAELIVERLATADADEAARFFTDAVAAGQEGVVAKDLTAPYDAGRRGSAWVKVKPRHTLDLVVLAVEWGSGRRQGWLSNIHLGARDTEGGFVMLGKTFKGMTDEMLQWQTGRFLDLETSRERHVVHVRPEQVVEIAFDGLQRSTRYPGGLALRFARVVRYRDDKAADEADTIDTVRTLGGPPQPE